MTSQTKVLIAQPHFKQVRQVICAEKCPECKEELILLIESCLHCQWNVGMVTPQEQIPQLEIYSLNNWIDTQLHKLQR